MMPDWADPVALVPGLPLLGAIMVATLRDSRIGAWIVIAATAAGFAAACRLPTQLGAGLFLLVDPLSAHLAMLTAFVGLTTALISRRYIAHELATGRLDIGRVQSYHTLFLTFLGFMLLALLSNNLGVAWVALEAATISAVLVVGLPRTDAAIEASWKFFILCGVGISLAFFGTVVMYLAALPALGPGYGAMTWTELTRAAPNCRATLLNLAFVFMLVGYGTKAGLAPLHSWMPDAHAEGPTPVSAVLAGSVLNVALLLILRLRGVMAANEQAIDPGPPIMVLGVLSVLLAAFSLWGRRDAKRFFAFSSIEQSGLAAFAIGLGGVGAIFAALLHMTVHTLSKAAVYQTIGAATQRKGGQRFTDIVGLISSDRLLGLTLAAGILAVAGLPPFGLFASEVLILSETMRQTPWLVPLLVLGLLVGGWKLLARLITLCLGSATEAKGPPVGWTALWPAWLHLAIGAVLGFAMPASIAAWLIAAARVVPGGSP
jgi:hydrogenase-4 component F